MARFISQLIASILAFGILCCLSAQQAIVRKDSVLREEPGAASTPEAHLQVGDKLTILDSTPEHGYYQVKTQDGKDGWVFSRSIKILASPSSSEPAVDPETTGVAQGGCDNSLWQHVYNPTRLIVKQQCISVTGVIVDATNGKEPDGVRHEADADTHGWLKLDTQFEDLLNQGNVTTEGGNLVFEIVCKFMPPSQTDAKPACLGYSNSVQVPPVGSHVRIVGSYVRDTNHAQWMEIHPVTSITVIP